MRLRRLFFLWLPLTVLGLGAAAAGLLGWVVFHPDGSRWAVRQGLAYAPMQASTGAVEGSLWRGLTLHQVKVSDTDWSLQARRLAWGWDLQALRGGRLHLTRLEGEGLRVTTAAAPAVDEPPMEIPERIELPLSIRLDRLLVQDLQVFQGDALAVELERIAGALEAGDDRLRIESLEAVAPTGEVTLSGQAALTRPFPFDARAAWSGPLPELGDGRGEAQISGDMQAIELDHQLTAPLELNTRGRIELSPLKLDLQGHWPLLRWPLAEQEPLLVQAKNASYRLQGPLDALAIELQSELSGRDLPPAALHFKGELHTQELAIRSLQLKALEGRLTASGRLGWAKRVNWDLRLEGAGLRPGVQWPDWPGELDLQAQVSGALEEHGPAVSADLQSLSGVLRGHPLSLSGGADYRAEAVRLRDFVLLSGENRVQADGPAFPEMDLKLTLNTPDLSAFAPQLSGAAEGDLRLQGTPQAPQLNGALSGQQIAYADYRLESAEITLHWPGGDRRETGNHLKLTGVDLAGQQWQRVELILLGGPQQHELELETEGGPADLQLAAAGALAEQRWRGQLTRLALLAGPWGDWQTTEAVTLDLSAQRAQWSALCLSAGKPAGRLCTQGAWNADSGLDASVEAADLDLQHLAPVMPAETALEGALNGRITARGQGDDLQAEGRIAAGDGRVLLPPMENLPRRVGYSNAAAEFTFAAGKLEASAGISLPQGGQADARLVLGPLQEDATALSGRIDMSFPDLDLIRGFVPQARFQQGSLALNADLGGTLQQPEIVGELRLKDGDLEVERLGARFRDLQFSARNQGREALTLSASARSGEGSLQLDGSVQLDAEKHFPLDLKIQGQDFQVVQTTEAQAQASPDIRIQGDTRQMQISGALRIPEATVEIKELPQGTVTVSEDEVIVGRTADREPPPEPAPTPLRGELEVALGEAVRFSGFGLQTRLTGSMGVRFTPQGTEAQGAILLKDGHYEAYGQDLAIEQGRFLFTGPPENPSLDIRAMRLSDDQTVKAYLRVYGTAQAPQTDVYAEPSMSKVQALSYLLTGHGTDHESDINLLEAAASLGLDKTQPALTAIAGTTGLDRLQVTTGSTLDEAALEGGKYLNPNLYVSYSQNLFTNQGALSLKYRLSDHLSVETKSGESQSVDLIYSIEKD